MSANFSPNIDETGKVRAGGMTLFALDPDSGAVVFGDRYLARCRQRGTPDVRVFVLDLLEAMVNYYVSLLDPLDTEGKL